MRIGIDTQATAGRRSGLGVYTAQLVAHLKLADSENEYVLLGNSRIVGERTYHRLIWENATLPLQAFKKKVDVLHTPAFAAPFWKGKWRTVVTIHDLIGKLFPQNLSVISRWYWGIWIPSINRCADRIIVDSECTKQDLIRHLRTKSDKIRVVPLAAGDHFRPRKNPDEIQRVCNRFCIRRPYILFVGNVEPRKNLLHIMRAFAKVVQDKKFDHSLVIVGSQSWDYPAALSLMKELDLSDRVNFLNYVNEDDLVGLYNGGDLLVFPSLYEGFGLPILEAMKCGMPVLTSNLSSMPEVAADAAYYVDPYREGEIESGIEAILSNRQLQEKLRAKGLIQAQKFSWKKVAEQTIAVYEELM